MDYSGFPTFPIPASIRRRLPRLYLSRAGAKDMAGDPRRGLASSSEPQLCNIQLVEPTLDSRPTTASDDLDFDAGSRGSETPAEEMGSPTKYEAESGLRWNRVVPGEFMLAWYSGYQLVAQLSLTGYEAQQPHADGRLARSLYVNALVYLLDALPQDLSAEETTMLQHHIPEQVTAALMTAPPRYVDREPRSCHNPRSYLHKVLASVILQVFILLRFLLPYVKLLLRQVYEYERTHRITERVLTATLDAADGLGKGSVNIGASVCRLNEGRVGAALSNLAAWWMEGVAGGIYEGVGEGMVHLGIIGQEVELGGFPMHSMDR
ncbi:unnamed protein product [Penicillium salamii]|uniref:Uncharacterized protein n=1 Tax=Penicillium salamii TaxID=1612424 RepID=A0A9W4NP13_9EURO|nr:unnamed protein product [Penicillium salamii]CAG7979494.1 unnamed protein product [Penicillium salamii]CAG8024257.1 unnamed protein product [Penicillium salamii]CAG8072444.1 unnamed protein product [Penicillium salamii]CAG8231070.1 unnamed protein product [Penicillium salamii]